MIQKEFVIRRGITDNYPRQLIINENFLTFQNNDLATSQFTTFQKDQIASYSFGVKWMRYYFVFGREYIITIKSTDGRIIKINFNTYFGRKKKEYHALCNEILSELWTRYFQHIATHFIEKHEAGQEFEIGNVLVAPDGIIIKTNIAIREKKAFIPWEKIKTKNYSTYFAIYAEDDTINTNRGYSYLNDWNTSLLRVVVLQLLEKKTFSQNKKILQE